MKFCPYCGSGMDDDMSFCPVCGKKYKGAATAEINVDTELIAPQPEQSTRKPKTKQRKHKKRVIVPILIAVLALLVVGLLIFVIVRHGNIAKAKPEMIASGESEENQPIPFSEDTEKIAALEKSVVKINCYNTKDEVIASGSGVILFDDTTIVTNFHVIDGVYYVHIITDEDMIYQCNGILAYSKEDDLAILKVEKPLGLDPLSIGTSTAVMKGEPVVAIGSPLGLKNTVSTGVLSGRVNYDDSEELQFTAPISSGSSGGALFNNAGEVIGITYASYIDGQNLNLAIPVESVDRLYQKAESEIQTTVEELCEKEHNELIDFWNGKEIDLYSIIPLSESNTSLLQRIIEINEGHEHIPMPTRLIEYNGESLILNGYFWNGDTAIHPVSYEDYISSEAYHNDPANQTDSDYLASTPDEYLEENQEYYKAQRGFLFSIMEEDRENFEGDPREEEGHYLLIGRVRYGYFMASMAIRLDD